jgi:hypothetical protein
MSDKVLKTVRANPSKRIMVIGSYKNREMLNRAVREVAPTRIIVASEWFEHLDLRVYAPPADCRRSRGAAMDKARQRNADAVAACSDRAATTQCRRRCDCQQDGAHRMGFDDAQ